MTDKEKITCPYCGGNGFTIESFNFDGHGNEISCNPEQVECYLCKGSGYFYRSQDFEQLEKENTELKEMIEPLRCGWCGRLGCAGECQNNQEPEPTREMLMDACIIDSNGNPY